jgi:predicted signal transduction protein with EAL and GGDEF domain
VRLAEFMHLQVIAEGIETAAQLQQVRDLNCAFGQGYHLGLPDRAAVFPQRSYPPGEPTAHKTAQEKSQSRLGDGNHEPTGSRGASGGQPQPQRPPGDQRRR